MIEVTAGSGSALGIVRKLNGREEEERVRFRPRCRGLSESDGGSDVIKEKEEEEVTG